jgi:hypothetical protein
MTTATRNQPLTMVRRLRAPHVWHLTTDGYNALCGRRLDAWMHTNHRTPADPDEDTCKRCRMAAYSKGYPNYEPY